MPTARPVQSLSPDPDPSAHQRYEQFPPEKLYEFHVKPFEHQFHPDLGPSTIWGYSSNVGPGSPGPTFEVNYGEPILVRIYNDLPPEANNGGFGKPEITTHLHNMHTATESDGFPGDFYPSGTYHDHHYAIARAGFSIPSAEGKGEGQNENRGNPAEALGTLWYHDHRVDFTSQNVYKGLAGMMKAYDDQDTGDEGDKSHHAFRLPSGDYDIPMIFADKRFDATPEHKLFLDIFDFDGFIGDQYTVNGAVQPYLKVARRKYRFRMLDTGPSRFYQFALSNGQHMTMIANDGNLLPAPIDRDSVRVTPAERMDVIVDFSKAKIGDEIYLVNIMDQWNGKGPTGILLPLDKSPKIIKFIVDRDAEDNSQIPATMRPTPVIADAELAIQRIFEFDSQNGAWVINGKQFDFHRVDALIKANTAEEWVLKNVSNDWQHPIHIHLEEHQIMSRAGVPPPDYEQGRKDVSVLLPGQTVVVRQRFRDWVGRYPMHCHNTVHEDHAMLLRWDVAP